MKKATPCIIIGVFIFMAGILGISGGTLTLFAENSQTEIAKSPVKEDRAFFYSHCKVERKDH